MRVIAGIARSVPLIAPKGKETRPTTDKIKETLFNILQFDVPGCLFVDLFAGSGAIGIEALSRGAERCLFADNSREAVECITKNVEKCHFEDKASILRTEAMAAVSRLKLMQRDDEDMVVFLDPPYDRGLEYPVIRALANQKLLRACDTLILEKSLEKKSDEELMEEISELGLEIYKEKPYKNQKHVFIRLKGDE
ncbi:MAG: 16S rRNA (guanine(966)-N(2))-methyltransferase RsmD [Eubacteriales bacterium]|nr:16S rRNA (guanine(966)-N(2))-methyltransferase RsmD [Eubacteriales bacterium]